MLKRFKRAGVWALALSMAVTMTPATAFADADAPEGADANGQNPVVQIDGEDPDAGEVVSEAENVNGDADSGESGKIEKKKKKIEDEKERKEEKKQDKLDKRGGTDGGQNQWVPLYEVFGIDYESSLTKMFPMTYGQVRSYGDSKWETGTNPELQPVEGQTLDESTVKREYAYFKNIPTLFFALMQDNMGRPDNDDENGKKSIIKASADGDNGDENEGIDYKSSAAGMTDPGYVLERITSLESEDMPVFAIHMTAVDVTVKADDASMMLGDDFVGEQYYTVTETIGDYPEELDMQMKMNYGTFGRNTMVKPVAVSESKEKSRLIPMFREEVKRWNDEDELAGVLWYNVVNHVVASEKQGKVQDEVIDLVNSGFFFNNQGGIFSPASEELNEALTANSEVADAIESGDMDEYLNALGSMSEEEEFDLSKICDPPLHVVMEHGTLYIYEDATPLPAKEGHVAKQMEATQLDGQYKTTVKMTLPLADGIDPEEYYKTLHYFGYGPGILPGKPGKIEIDPGALNVRSAEEESLDAQAVRIRLGDSFSSPKQNQTLPEESVAVLDLSSDFTLPVDADGNLDLSKLKLVDYQYHYRPEIEGDPLGAADSDDSFDEWLLENVFNSKPVTDDRGYTAYDLKGYRLSLPFEEDIEVLAEGNEDEPAVEVFGFGLLGGSKEVRPAADETDSREYWAEEFAYVVIYLPEGAAGIPELEEIGYIGYPFDPESLEDPCMVIAYQGTRGENGNLNPLHYFTFQFDEILNNVSNAAGTHGSYDQYGKSERNDIRVLDSATLYRPNVAIFGADYERFKVSSVKAESSHGMPQEKPEEFYIPTVSYTINGGGGSGGRSSGGLSSTTITEPQVPLAELPELNKKDHVAYVIGYEDGTVRPENLITRAEVSTIFFRLLTDDSRQAIWSSSNSYKDTAADAWYNNAVSTLSNGGVLSGYTDGTFLPSGNITRAEFATIAARFDESTVDTSSVSFSDISGHWAENNIKRAAALGYITGYQDGSFKPNAPITRAEAMTLMNRVLGRDKISAAGLLDNMAKWSDNPATAWYYVAVQEATNTHDYTITDGVETWTSILANRDWAALEKEWATGAERGAEVFQPVEEEEPAAESEAGTEAEA